MEHVFKLYEFNPYNDRGIEEEDTYGPKKDNAKFVIQMFAINEKGEKASIMVEEYQPFFYLKVNNDWGQTKKKALYDHLKAKVGKYYENSIIECKLIERKKLYGFDAGKKHRFIEVKFANLTIYNKVKNLWYREVVNFYGEKERKLLPNGYKFDGCNIELYEGNIPPLLRLFHIRQLSPSGWIAMPISNTTSITGINKTTSCDFEFVINYKHIIPLNHKEDRVPYKIMSFDIEASSSHGDFPVPIKSYKKLATNIVDHFAKISIPTPAQCALILRDILRAAFGFIAMEDIDLVYPKKPLYNEQDLSRRTDTWLKTTVKDCKHKTQQVQLIEKFFENATNAMQLSEKDEDGESDGADSADSEEEEDLEEEDAEEDDDDKSVVINENIGATYEDTNSTIIDIMCDAKFEREGKINELVRTLRNHFPALEGDKVTFIGSTFMTYGEQDPYLNHCIVLNSCDDMRVSNGKVETYDTEKEVLLAWTKLVQEENPDIIIGYNIFGFDYEFMFRRSQELGCTEDFLKLSRNIGEICATTDYKNPEKIDIKRMSMGLFDSSIIEMNGRLQVDMLNWFRKTENFTSYKLDYVGGHIIGDTVKNLLHLCRGDMQVTRIATTNMTGLQPESYIHFEEIMHSSDYYKNGQKFKVVHVCKEEGWFEILGTETPHAKQVKWGLAKDDVTPKDIFRMTNEGPASRAIIAKYCIQDCNLVHYLFNKVDVLTDLIEMSKLCSVPMSFLIFRGQGIKLTSYVAKKCREKGVLMPVVDKGSHSDGFEGAIVLYPKCALYLDDPIGVGDFASLYPSSILSENLCMSSKLWTKNYDLAGNLISETGEKNAEGRYIYDNLPGLEYVNIPFDTYRYVKKTPKGKAVKVKSGRKICRFVQSTFKNGAEEKAIMPSILQELLKARKDTRKLIPQTNDDFIKNVLEKRQLAYKLTANSLYGQLGAKTSTFYEPDVAAATTATGRMLLTFAKRVIEECYANETLETKHGFVNTNAEYVYGDSVANYTPIYVSTFKQDDLDNRIIDIVTIEELAQKYGYDNWVKCVEPGKQDKEFCELENVETWTERGWTPLHRVIRHELASHKKMIRVLTHTGCVDVTDDHSLVKNDGTEISPNHVSCGTELLHCSLPDRAQQTTYDDVFTGHFDNMLDASIYVNNLNNQNISFSLNSGEDLSIIVVPNPLGTKNSIAVKKMYEIPYSGYVYDLTTENHHFAAGVGNMIVHNTDSVFFKFNLTDTETGEKIVGEKALEISIEIAQQSCHQVSKVLKQPHDFEYEKTFMPFCLLSKKRYVGIKFEFDPTKGKRTQMGMVLKRRDNAPIVKDVYGSAIDILMEEKNIPKAIECTHSWLRNLVSGNIPIDKLKISKALRSYYKKPMSIAHKVLADRIGRREPGNKPTSGDRIEYVYIVNNEKSTKKKKILQGDRIETPAYIKDHNIKIDYSFYITNQIMKPLLQLFGLVLKEIWLSQKPPRRAKVLKLQDAINQIKTDIDDEKACETKVNRIKNAEVKDLIFSSYLRDTHNAKNNNQSLTKFFKAKEC
jgi:DNA polymerase elongation subunit (family B)